MVADTAQRHSTSDGLRPLSLARDWGEVIELIEVAFGDALDAEAQRALHSMRPPPLIAPLIGLLSDLSPPGEGMMPGFVWVEQGRVVGTASARRLHPARLGWLISNVAVHPDWQGRGIGRALVEACLDLAARERAAWIALQVRGDNPVARNLYASLHFQEVGDVIRLCREPVKSTEAETPSSTTIEGLRPARWTEGDALFRLARSLTRHDMLWADAMDRHLYRTGILNRLLGRLQRYRRRWWVKEEPGSDRRRSVAVGLEMNVRNPWHRLRLLIPPQAQDRQLASDLITFALTELAKERPLPVEIEHPGDDEVVQTALIAAGFVPIYTLVHMRRDFK